MRNKPYQEAPTFTVSRQTLTARHLWPDRVKVYWYPLSFSLVLIWLRGIFLFLQKSQWQAKQKTKWVICLGWINLVLVYATPPIGVKVELFMTFD